MLPEAVAVKVVTFSVPPRLSIPVALFTNAPEPAKSVPTVNVFVLFKVTEVVIDGIVNVPVNV